MHDGIEIERLGIPAVVICTDEFERTGNAISEMRGAPGYPFVVVQHPIGILDENALAGRADKAMDRVVELLLQPSAKL